MNSTNTDIQDIQDRMGYVDTGPSQPPSKNSTRNLDTLHPPVVTSSTSHITIKEPKPIRQVHILNKGQEPKKRSTLSSNTTGFNNKPPEIENNKPSYYQQQPQQPLPKPIIKKSTSMDTGNYHLNVPTSMTTNYYNDSNERSPTENNNNNRTPFMNYPTSSAPNMTGTNNEELKERVVHKLLELAEMVSYLNLENHRQLFDSGTYYEQGPHPTPSKSDPSHRPLPHYQPQPIRRTGSNSRKKYIPSSPGTNRQQFNKSADATMNYGDGRPAYHYDDDYNYYPYYEPPQDMYDDYRGGYMDEPYQYAPPLPPPQQQRYRPRRKSYTNLRDEEMLQQQQQQQQFHHRLQRKSSRGNMNNRRPPPHPSVMYEPYLQQQQPEPLPSRYHYYPPHPQYSPDAPYYHH
ncbi:unnamed protein product [Mucor hiemalis]